MYNKAFLTQYKNTTTQLVTGVASANTTVVCGTVLDVFCDVLTFIKFGAAADLTTSLPIAAMTRVRITVPAFGATGISGSGSGLSGAAGGVTTTLNAILPAATGNVYITPMAA